MATITQTGLAPGQVYGKRWVFYSALGDPAQIGVEDWHLRTSGLVQNPLDLTWEAIHKLPQATFTADFQCVTRWSIKDVVWEGVLFREIAKLTGIKPEAKWVMFKCADGYTAPVPLEDAMSEKAIIAFKMNGKPIPPHQGAPSRPFIPHLYGWKSAKWLNEIQFIPDYVDGYWEMYGYHERGNIWNEERFKTFERAPSGRKVTGVSPI